MKQQNIINLIKYHVEKNDEAFTSEVVEIAKDFDKKGITSVAQYLMELISTVSMYIPQNTQINYRFLKRIKYSTKPLLLPKLIEEDVLGIIKAVSKNSGLSKFLFFGNSGTGKSESAYQIARLLKRDVFVVDFEQIIDSKLGETSKNVVALFDEINHLQYQKSIIVLDEIDTLVLDRINSNDLREMGRVTSTFLRELDSLNENIVLIATTNLIANFDKALLRRFDAQISFDRYEKNDLIEIADSLLTDNLKKYINLKKDIRLFNKILNNLNKIPYPGDLKQIIKTSIAFCDETNEYDYLRKVYLSLNNETIVDIKKLKSQGYTTREIEILSKIPKSSVSRKLRGVLNE